MLFDVYTGRRSVTGKKSLAYALRFRAPDRTLTDAEAAEARDAAVAAAAEQTGAVQRASDRCDSFEPSELVESAMTSEHAGDPRTPRPSRTTRLPRPCPWPSSGRPCPWRARCSAGSRQRGIAPAGPPFWRYLTIEMPDRLEIECGVPVGAAVAGDDRVLAGELPAGRYATVLHVGHPDDLVETTGELLDWADREGLALDASPDQRSWGCRLEEYLTDPEERPICISG